MCGIIAYAGHRPAVPIIVEGLRRLEYRGYDSAGVAYVQQSNLQVIRCQGKLCGLEDKLSQSQVFDATTALGHTRWATHGLPVEKNAHPHKDINGRLAMVHNGIIENYQALKTMLVGQRRTCCSDTDTEVLVQLISLGLEKYDTIPQAMSWALSQVEGTYAIALLDTKSPNKICAARKSSPLLLGVGIGENFVASDIPAFLTYTRDVIFLQDNELVEMDAGSWKVYDVNTLEPLDN